MADPGQEIEGPEKTSEHGSQRPEVFPASHPVVPQIQFEMSLGGRPNAAAIIAAKMTPDQIGEAIRSSAEDKKADQAAGLESMKATKQVIFAGLAALVVIVFIFLHYGHAAELKDIVLIILSAGVGAGGGYTAGRIHRSKPHDV